MAAPTCLSGATTTMTIDGVDMHTYGMTVLRVSNPLPAPVESMVPIYGKDGAFDFSRSLSIRYITVEGEIVADSHSDLLTYIDGINKLIRIREGSKTAKLIFSDQPNRYWTVRIQSSDLSYNGLKSRGKTMAYTMRFVCAKPFAESTSVTVVQKRLTIFNHIEINYQGTIKTPLNLRLTNIFNGNIVEEATTYNDTYQSAWASSSNCSISYESGTVPYGQYATKVTRSASGEFVASIDLSSYMETGKDYQVICYVKQTSGSDTAVKISLDMGGVYVVEEYAEDTTSYQMIAIDVSSEETAFASQFILKAVGNGLTEFYLNATAVYEYNSRYDSYLSPIHNPYVYSQTLEVDPVISLFRGRNIFPYNNGDDIGSGWLNADSIISITKDPIGDENIILLQCPTGGEVIHTPTVRVVPGEKYHVSYERMVVNLSGPSINTGVFYYTEAKEIQTGSEYIETITSENGSNFTQASTTITIPTGATGIVLWFYMSEPNTILYIKNIMVCPEINSGESVPDYEESNEQAVSYLNNIDQNDALSIDNDYGFARYEDVSAKTSSNAMADFSGDLLEIAPGYNYLRLKDNRTEDESAIDIESESVGSVGVILSYRERYL